MEKTSRTFVMMAGLPGAGKTTLAYALQDELGWRVIDKDAHRIMLLKQGLDEELAANQAYEYSFAEIRHELARGQNSVIFDTAALHRSIVDIVLEMIKGIEDVQLKVILCVVDREARDHRLRTRPQQHTRNTVEPATIADYLRCFEHLPQNKLIIFTNVSPEECLAQAKAYIKS